MGLGAKIFNIFRPKRDPTKFDKKTSLVNAISSTFNNIMSESDNVTFVSAVNTHARNLSKIQLLCYKDTEVDKSASARQINYLLNIKPNRIQSAADFYECIGKQYFGGNLVIIYIQYDELNDRKIKALWVVDYLSASFAVRNTTEGLIYRFTVDNQEVYATEREIILLTREADISNIFGKRSKVLMQSLNVINTAYQGIEKAVKSSAFIRFLITSTTPLSDQAKKDKAKYFADTFLGVEDSSGVAYADNVASILKVDTPPKYSSAAEIDTLKSDIYEYLTITPKIIKGDFNEDEWQAYYESAIEPLINNLSQKLTSLIYTEREIVSKNYEIRPMSSKLHTASLKTRILIAQQLLRMPVIRPNIINELLYIPALDNGDKEYATLNYIEAEMMGEYQLSKVKGKEEVDSGTTTSKEN